MTNDLISRSRLLTDLQETLEAWSKYPVMEEEIKGIEVAIAYVKNIPSAQPELSDDGTLLMTVPHGILSDVKRVLVDEVGTKNCKMMYQDEPERKKGTWIKISPANIYECSECGKNVMTDDISAYDFCHGCGSYNGGNDDGDE